MGNGGGPLFALLVALLIGTLAERAAWTPSAKVGDLVEVSGAVARPGVVRLPPGTSLGLAVAHLARQPPPLSPARANVALHEGDRVVVDRHGVTVDRGHALLFGQRVDLNLADRQALMALPGIGPRRVAAVVGARPFFGVRDLARVRGLGAAAVAAAWPLAWVADPPPPTPVMPVSINGADARTLQRLPGVGPVLAGRIVHHRETYGAFTSLTQLSRVPGIGPVRLAALLPVAGL